MTPDMIYDSPPRGSRARARGSNPTPHSSAALMMSMKCRRWHLQCGGFCSYLDCDPAPKNLVFQHEVTNLNPTRTPTPTLGESEGGERRARALSINFALQWPRRLTTTTKTTDHDEQEDWSRRRLTAIHICTILTY